MFSIRRKNKVKAGALYYVIFLVFIISSVCSLLLMHRGIVLKQVREEIRYFEKLDDLDSGLAVYLKQGDTYQQSNQTSIFLFEDSARRVNISQESHGLLDLLRVQVHYHGKTIEKLVLAGSSPFGKDSIALYVPENSQGLYASGRTIVNGNVSLPSKGIQRASIEGKPLQRSNAIFGKKQRSAGTLPAFSQQVREKILLVQDLDSLQYYSTDIFSLRESHIEQDFSGETLWYYSDEDYQISDITAKGRIGFLSRGTILLKKDAQLDQVILSASRIVVEDGFRGNIQLFAMDSMVIGTQCHLTFPSVVCLNNDNVNPVYLEIGMHSQIHGTIICKQEHLSTEKPYMRILDGAKMFGQVYHKGKIELLGSIYGSLYCESFYRKTRRAYYVNHLLDNEIDFYKLPACSSFIDLEKGYVDQVIQVFDYGFQAP